MKKMIWIFALIFCLNLSLSSMASGGMIKETWYMSRGKANMKIKNYKAAIEAFEKLVEIDPENREAMKLLGLAYENQGLTPKAVEHYDRYLKQFPDDAHIAFKQAKILEWSRFSYRRNDAVTYYRMGLSVSDDPIQRHRLAKLLSEDKKTLAEALKEYRILIKGDPQNRTIGDEYRKLLLWDDRFLNEAITEYERAMELSPDDKTIPRQLARLYVKDDRYTKKAIQKYTALVDEEPGDMVLREEYARALAKSKAHFTEAKSEFEYVLARRNTYDTRLSYADLISRDKSFRKDALDEYRKLLDQKPGETDVRLKYAALLAGEKEDLDPAIAQYNLILKKNPGHVAAHQKLAHAYAWKGDKDRSIHHANLALSYQPRNANASRLKNRMMKGREPRLTTTLSMFNQKGDDENYDMYGAALTTGFKADITPFITGQADVGYEWFWKGDTGINGPLGRLALQYRPTPGRTWNGSITHHGFRDGNSDNDYGLEYVHENPTYTLAPGFKRSLRYDSLLSLGSPDAYNPPGSPMGAARSNMLYCRVENTRSKVMLTGRVYGGTIQTRSAGNNLQVGMEAGVDYEFLNKSPHMIAIVYRGQIDHYQKNFGGFIAQNSTVHPGGYFSPHLYLNNILALSYRHEFLNDAELLVQAGPCLQYVRESSGETSVGADISLSYVKQLKEALYIKAEGDYKQVGDIYRKFSCTAVVTYRF